MNVILETKNLFQFLKKQLPRLHKAIYEDHSLNWKQVIIWSTLINIGIYLLSFALNFSPSFFYVLQNFIPGLITSTIAGILFFVLVAGAIGAGIQQLRGMPLNWNSWFESFFIITLPQRLLLPIVIILLPSSLTLLLSLSTMGLTLYWLYEVVCMKFPLPNEKSKKQFKVGLLLLGLFLITFQSGLLLSNKYSDKNLEELLSKLNIEHANPEAFLSGPIPPKYLDEVKTIYPQDTKRQKAALQYAIAVWAFATTKESMNDYNHTEMSRSVACLDIHDIDIDIMRKIKSIVLQNPHATRAFLRNDKDLHGKMFSYLEYDNPCDN